MTLKKKHVRSLATKLSLIAVGGSVLGTVSCETRWRTAWVDASQTLFYATVLNPETYLPIIEEQFNSTTSDTTTDTGDGTVTETE